MPGADYYTYKIGQLLNQGSAPLESFGVPTYLQQIPGWMQKQAAEGLGVGVQSAMFRIQNRQAAGTYKNTLRDIVQNEGAAGLSGGFGNRLSELAGEEYAASEAGTRFEIGRQSDQARLQAKQQMLGIEQFNKQLTFGYQQAMQQQETAMRQMRLSELMAQRGIEAQKAMQEESNWWNLAGNLLGAGLMLI